MLVSHERICPVLGRLFCDDAVVAERCAEFLETIPNFDEIERKTTEEVQKLDQFLASGEGGSEVEKYGTTTPTDEGSAVESAFKDLLG